jgi:uncharacterized lipoprotein NlpE involved in copper resistance
MRKLEVTLLTLAVCILVGCSNKSNQTAQNGVLGGRGSLAQVPLAHKVD